MASKPHLSARLSLPRQAPPTAPIPPARSAGRLTQQASPGRQQPSRAKAPEPPPHRPIPLITPPPTETNAKTANRDLTSTAPSWMTNAAPYQASRSNGPALTPPRGPRRSAPLPNVSASDSRDSDPRPGGRYSFGTRAAMGALAAELASVGGRRSPVRGDCRRRRASLRGSELGRTSRCPALVLLGVPALKRWKRRRVATGLGAQPSGRGHAQNEPCNPTTSPGIRMRACSYRALQDHKG
jgi:hypothetical protein